jgi:hypothetical protein
MPVTLRLIMLALAGLCSCCTPAAAADLPPAHEPQPAVSLPGPAEMPPEPQPNGSAEPASNEPSEASIHVPPDASCIAWTDGCRYCTLKDGKAACSNIGIACQPQTVSCKERTPPSPN